MSLYQKLLVPTDFSPTAEKALAFAGEMARVFGGEIVLFHVIPRSKPASSIVSSSHFPNLEDEIRKGAMRQMEDLRDAHLPESDCRIDLEMGTPFAAILRAVERENPDLIIIGTRGNTGLKHALMGSTAERVVREARCPVLTVK